MTVVDVAIFAIVAVIASAVSIPIVERATESAQQSALLESLHTLQTQIDVYKLQHRGRPPVLHNGSLPQLYRSTDAHGQIGPAGKKFPLGPYLRGGIPLNPMTERSIVTPVDTFPPTAPSGNGGWLYHQPTGQIAIDIADYLDR